MRPDPFRMNFLTIQKDEEINLQATHMCSYLKKEKQVSYLNTLRKTCSEGVIKLAKLPEEEHTRDSCKAPSIMVHVCLGGGGALRAVTADTSMPNNLLVM